MGLNRSDGGVVPHLAPAPLREGEGGIAIHLLRDGFQGNIGHAFHEAVQHYVKRTAADPRVKAWITESVKKGGWYEQVLIWCARHLGVRLIKRRKTAEAEGLKVINGKMWRIGDKSKFLVNGRGNGGKRPDKCPLKVVMGDVLGHVRCAAWSEVGEPMGFYSLLHTRHDAARRRLVDWEQIGCRFDKVVHNFKLSVTKQVHLVQGAHTLVGPLGASFTNVIFMRPTATAIEVIQKSSGRSASWQAFYGTCASVRNYYVLKADMMRARKGAKGLRSHAADDDMVVTDALALKICEKMRTSPCLCQQRL